MSATDILGKIGEKVGTQIKSISTDLQNNFATKVSLGQATSGLTDATAAITDLENTKASQVSLNNYASGSSVFSLIKGTRAELGELKVTGEMTVINTQTVEVSDNIIELNKAENGAETAQTSGLEINRGTDEDKARFIWNDTQSDFSLLLGDTMANLNADSVIANLTGNVTGTLTGSVDASAQGESVAVGSGSAFTINEVALGDYATFEAAFNSALS